LYPEGLAYWLSKHWNYIARYFLVGSFLVPMVAVEGIGVETPAGLNVV